MKTLLAIVLAVFALSGCSLTSDFDQYEFADSDGGLPDEDAEFVPEEDAGTDSGTDSGGTDAGTDSGVDAGGTDSGVDSGVDAAPEPGIECDACASDDECSTGFGCFYGAVCEPTCDTCKMTCTEDNNPRTPECQIHCETGCYITQIWGNRAPGVYVLPGSTAPDSFAFAAACAAR